MTLTQRVAAAQATLKAYKDQPFKFGTADCFQMVRTHAVRMECAVREWGQVGPYHSVLGGQRRLAKAGHANLIAAMDAHFARIAPAAALPGDVVALPGQEGPGALTVALGNGRVLGWHEDAPGACVMQPKTYHTDDKGLAAWRVVSRGDPM
jgi:hypothetical protein